MTTGYGRDTWCLDKLSPGRYATGAMLVAQALYRRLITPRGTLIGGDEESAYGFDVSAYVGSVGYPIAEKALPGLVRGELSKDDRVSDVFVEATIAESSEGAGLLSIELAISVVLVDEGESFSLTLAVSNVSVSILGGLPS